MGRGLAGGPSNGFGLGARGKVFDDENGAISSGEMMKTDRWKGAMYKDDVMRALTYSNENEAETALRARGMSGAALSSALISAKRIGYGRSSQIAAGQQLATNKTGYENSADAMETVERIAGGNGVLGDSLRENIKFTSKQVGRNDMGALRARNAGETRQAWNANMTSAGFENIDTFSLGREHAQSYKNMADAHAEQYAEAVRAYVAPGGQTTMNRESVIAARTNIEETIKNASSATGTNAAEAFGLADTIGGADEEIRRVDSAPMTDASGTPLLNPDGSARMFSPILGEQLPLPVQGAVQGQIGTGGMARSMDENMRRIRDRE
ncbi:MAG: hypothetical protein WCJ24_03020 [Candidatus Saccharibacteria bacterium]